MYCTTIFVDLQKCHHLLSGMAALWRVLPSAFIQGEPPCLTVNDNDNQFHFVLRWLHRFDAEGMMHVPPHRTSFLFLRYLAQESTGSFFVRDTSCSLRTCQGSNMPFYHRHSHRGRLSVGTAQFVPNVQWVKKLEYIW